MIDNELLAFDSSTPEGLLWGLLNRQEFLIWKFDDVAPRDARWSDWGLHKEGWAILGEEVADGQRALFYSKDGEGRAVTSISEIGIGRFERDVSTVAYRDLDPFKACDRRRCDYRALRVAGRLSVDLFVTAREYLLTRESDDSEPDVLSVEDALPIVSLFLRRQDCYAVNPGNFWDAAYVDRGYFYLLAMRSVLPSSWRFSRAAGMHASLEDDSNDTLSHLAWSTLQRVERSLIVRDDLHIVLNRPQGNQTADDAVAHLDYLNLLILGAFDATARFVHELFSLAGPRSQIGWHNERWTRRLREVAPALAGIFASNPIELSAYEIVRKLRNYVHGEIVQTVHMMRHGLGDASLVALPRADMDELLQLMSNISDLDSWPVHSLMPGQAHIDPGQFADKLLPLLLVLLDRVLEGVTAECEGQSDSALPEAPTAGIESQENLNYVRWQLGLVFPNVVR